MDDKAVEQAGITPLQGSFAQIAGLKSKDDLPAVIASLQQGTASDGFLFTFGAAQDLADASRVIAAATRGCLGLPATGSASCRDSVCTHVYTSGVAVSLKYNKQTQPSNH